jgi:hypothetical protein
MKERIRTWDKVLTSYLQSFVSVCVCVTILYVCVNVVCVVYLLHLIIYGYLFCLLIYLHILRWQEREGDRVPTVQTIQ